MDLAPGRIIERYQVERLLGRGGMASVYLVTHQVLGTPYALKVLTAASPKVQRRLLVEGQIQARLKHPNVVQVSDVLDVEGSPGLVMEYVEGPTLSQHIAGGPLDLAEAQELFLGILDGVARAHELGIIHRDLKPSNVLLQRDRGGLVPKVVDFGVAKALEDEVSLHDTRTGAALGTPSTMAPEQIRDARSVDHRADIFSLGCMLYQMVTGQNPFRQKNMLETFLVITRGRYRPAVELRPELPDAMQAAIDGALMVDRRRRIQDCARLRRVMLGQSRWIAPPRLPPEEHAAREPVQSDLQVLGTVYSTLEGYDTQDQGSASGDDDLVEGGTVLEPPTRGDTAVPVEKPSTETFILANEPPEDPGDPVETRSDPARGRLLLSAAVVVATGLAAYALFVGPGRDANVPAEGASPPTQAAQGLSESLEPPAPAGEHAPGGTEPTPNEPELAAAPPDQNGQGATVRPNPASTESDPVTSSPAGTVSAPTDPKGISVEDQWMEVEPPTEEQASYSFEGADEAWLEQDGQRFPPGSVPPGTYDLMARFGDGESVPSGKVKLQPGEQVTFHCRVIFKRCSR